MLERTISAISLSNADFPSFDAKLEEAARWVEYAAGQGAQLAVLPETINLYKGDGPDNPEALSIQDVALGDWQSACASLIDTAKRCGIALVLPLFVREGDDIINVALFLNNKGELIGEYRKMHPTNEEIDDGVRPHDEQPLIDWDGLKVGGAICFDTNYTHVFEQQAKRGAQLFIIPSLWPGGTQLDHFATFYSTPIVLAYPAYSRIIDMDGRELAAGGYRHETLRFGFGAPVYTATINFDRFPVWPTISGERMCEIQRKYGPKVRMTFNQPNCEFYLESRSESVTARQIAEDFDLKDRRGFIAQCGRYRDDALKQKTAVG